MKYQLCSTCNLKISNANYQKHTARCKGEASYFLKKKHGMYIADPTRKKQIDWKAVQEFYDNNHSTADVCKEFKTNFKKISDASKAGDFIPRSRPETRRLLRKEKFKHSGESIAKIRNSMRLAVIEGRHKAPRPYGTKCIHYKHTSWLGNVEHLQGSWEKRVAEHLDLKQYTWCKPRTSFTYTWNNNLHEYFPDFYIEELDAYIEVKGYKQDRDVAKWSQFPHKLIIIDKTNLNNLDQVI